MEGLLGWNFVLCDSTLPYNISALSNINDDFCDCFITQPSCRRITDGEHQCRPGAYPAMHSQPCCTRSSMPDDLREVITDGDRNQTHLKEKHTVWMDEQKIPLSWHTGTYLNPLHDHTLNFFIWYLYHSLHARNDTCSWIVLSQSSYLTYIVNAMAVGDLTTQGANVLTVIVLI